MTKDGMAVWTVLQTGMFVVREMKGQDKMLEFKNVSYVVSDDLGTKEIICFFFF